MKLKLVVLHLEIPPRIKRWALRIGIPLAILLGVSAVAFASLPQFADKQVLTADALNSSLNALDSRLAKLEGAGVAVRYTHPSQLALAQTADNNITGWTKVFDDTSAFEPTGGVFVAPIAGTYLITAVITWPGASASITHRFWINGSSIGQNFLDFTVGVASGYPMVQRGTYTAKLKAGDTIYLQVFTDEPTAGNRFVGGDARSNYVQINRLSD